MKIALFSTGIYPYVVGGMQKHSYYLAKYLVKNKVHVDLYHFVPHNEPLVEKLEGFSNDELQYITHFCFHFEKPSKYPGHYIVESYESSKKIFEKFMQNKEVDFVYAQGFSGWYYAKQKSKGISLPSVGVNFHGLEMFQKAASLKVKLEQLMFHYPVKRVVQLSDYTFSLGGKLTQILENITDDSSKVLTTPIGIDNSWLIKKISNNNDKTKSFVFVGRYERRKGIEELTNVLKTLESEYDFIFHFIGPIQKEKQINSKKALYHGLVKEEEIIKKILRETDVLVSPSYAEGMPTVILEAMASGCAIIATDVGAVSEEVDATNGWLIAPGDETSLKTAMIDAIECSDSDLLLKKAASLDRIKEKFLWDDVVHQTLNQIAYICKKSDDE